jgi:adenosylcobinamide-phosphate synthase
MLFQWYSSHTDVVHPLLVAILAFALDVAIGDPPKLYSRIPHPVVLFGNAISFFDQKLNRDSRSNKVRFWRGAGVTLSLVTLAGIIGYAIQFCLSHINYGWFLGALIASVFIAYRSLFNHVKRVANEIEFSLDRGQAAVGHIVGRDPKTLDEHGVARAAIESTAENFSDAVVAPLLWFAVLGLPGLFVYKAINTMDSMIGHRDRKYEYFGKFTARLDDAVNAVPARVAGLLIVISATIGIGTRGGEAWTAAVRDAEKHRSVNAGWPEAAMGGALGLALAGPRHYQESEVEDAWMNHGGRKEATSDDIYRALSLYRKASGGLAVFLFLLMAFV